MAEEVVDWLLRNTPEWKDKAKPCRTRVDSLPTVRSVETSYAEEIVKGSGVSWHQIEEAFQSEMATSINDALVRRTRLAWFAKDHGQSILPKVRKYLSKEFGISEPELDSQEQDFQKSVSKATSGLERGQSSPPQLKEDHGTQPTAKS